MIDPRQYHTLNWLSGSQDNLDPIGDGSTLYPNGQSSWVDENYPNLAGIIQQARNASSAGDNSLAEAFNEKAARVEGEPSSLVWWAGLAQIVALSELPPPPPAEIPHQLDSLPTGTIITKTPGGWNIQNHGGPQLQHDGGFHGLVHRLLAWLHLA